MAEQELTVDLIASIPGFIYGNFVICGSWECLGGAG